MGTLQVKRWHEIHASACTLAILVEQMEQCRLGGHGDYCSAEKEEKVDRTAHVTPLIEDLTIGMIVQASVLQAASARVFFFLGNGENRKPSFLVV